MKVELQRPKPFPYIHEGHRIVPLKACLPFYWSRAGTRIHRVRSAQVFVQPWGSHAGYQLWCGQVGLSSNGRVTDDPPDGLPYCATCEGRAIGAGLLGTKEIAGKQVIFSPRNPRRQP